MFIMEHSKDPGRVLTPASGDLGLHVMGAKWWPRGVELEKHPRDVTHSMSALITTEKAIRS